MIDLTKQTIIDAQKHISKEYLEESKSEEKVNLGESEKEIDLHKNKKTSDTLEKISKTKKSK